MEEDKKIKEYRERFNRWHLKQIDLLTFLINFLFTICIAVSGFVIANQDKPFFKCKIIFEQYSLSRTAILILAISVTAGVCALITRLEDFRRTKKIPKYRRDLYEAGINKNLSQDEISKIKTKRDQARNVVECLGTLTWWLFYLQLASFMIALWLLVIES
jgi:hypothetical protein